MSSGRAKCDEDFKKNAVSLLYVSPRMVTAIAADLGISVALLYRWRKKYTAHGEKTKYATLEEENKALRLELAKAHMEADMLKKTAVHFASLHKAGSR